MIDGDEMRRLCATLASLEEGILSLERRGINLKTHSTRLDPETGRLPIFHAMIQNEEFWFYNRKQIDDFINQRQQQTGKEINIGSSHDFNNEDQQGNKEMEQMLLDEFHEIKTINAGLKELDTFGFNIQTLFPEERTGIEEPRFILKRGETNTGVDDLRELIGAVRAAGEKGIQLTRFKGLGEMNAEELRETTLDPENRTLIQVKMENAAEADKMFRILMGDKVEPRREFIEKYALDVRELDI
jgi:DNA gyrase subunit B